MKPSIKMDGFGSNTICKLTKLFRDGNANLQQRVEKGILLLGNAGVGKSTFAHALAGRELQAVVDEDTNQLTIDAAKPLAGIAIEHKSSEIKVLSKCQIKDLVIFEFPGFDNSDPVDEISEMYYMEKLFEITSQLKFVLLVSESDLRSKKGAEFLETVSSFLKYFKDVEYVAGSVSLVITKVSKRKNIQTIRKNIEEVLACNRAVSENVRTFISEMKFSSLYLFHEPNEEHSIVVPDLLKCIESSGKYAVVNEYKIEIDMSADGRALSSYFLRTISNNFTQIVEITVDAISNATSGLNDTENNAFSENHHLVKDWVPSSFRCSSHRIMKNQRFPVVEMLSSLKNTLCHKVSDTSDTVRIIKQTHEILLQNLEANSDLHREIQEYTYCLKQQYGFMKYLATVCEIDPLDHGALHRLLKSCYQKTEKNLENVVINLCVSENEDEDYYYQAIEILENYRQFPDCMKQLEVAYRRLAEATQSKNRYSTLIINVIKRVATFLISVPRKVLSISFRIIRIIFFNS